MVVYSGTLAVTTTVLMALTLEVPTAALILQDVALLQLLFLRDIWGVGCLATKLQQLPQFQMPFQLYANYAMGSPQMSFFFRLEHPTDIVCMFWCQLWCIIYAFRFQCGCHCHLWGLNHWDLHHCSPLEYTHGRHMCIFVLVWGPCQAWTKWLLPPLLWVGGALCYSISYPPAIPAIWRGIQLWRLSRVTWFLWLPFMAESDLFQVWFHPMTWSTLNQRRARNLVILVWWLGIRVMSLFAPGW